MCGHNSQFSVCEQCTSMTNLQTTIYAQHFCQARSCNACRNDLCEATRAYLGPLVTALHFLSSELI